MNIGQYLQELFASPTSLEWEWFGVMLLGLFCIIGATELIRKFFHWSEEVVRKFVYITVGILIFFAPAIFQAALPMLVLSIIFIGVNVAAIRMGLLKGMHDTGRKSYGTVYYPLALLILVLFFWNLHREIVSLSMLGLALGDAFAAVVGESLKAPTMYALTADKKSVEGSFVMFSTTFVSLVAGMYYIWGADRLPLLFVATTAAVASIIATAWESISSRGLDNLTIPLSIAFVLYYFLVPSPQQDVPQFTLGVTLAIWIAVSSFYGGFLTASGAVATFLLAATVFGVGGWKWTVPILSFFVLSSLLSKFGRMKKIQFDSVFEKSGTRDYGQVAANGGVAGILAVLTYLIPSANLYPLYLGAVAAVTADTWGTEIGVLVSGKTISVATLKPVEIGSSGGVSFAGFTAGALGSAVIALSAFWWNHDHRVILWTIVAGVAGSLVDSIVGSTFQVQYRCTVCGKMTERTTHCEEQTERVKGIAWMSNDTVNWICAVTGAGTMLAFMQ